ncbi:aminotransferase class I/II-fold pyridoxal phosphate-dependent enzyme [Algoriphagus persicinus]|uniref:aminotransferase class I/II-fold pyridoxal phosphate-dependent enzyme n=1 Tax=Algoriphagus persicinus TaxID=3108754 RepID=UPI002B388D91|nr:MULTISPECIES: aminotransferase class I/II-fold pyridoxal phosphate-dependent enzyme [unclassified Algoriphagus]MEB2780121.1 aminotransferase class I/II-fold pyridoxal phosphate-dependent enzyme [Algoriphagus sp. C2-6-M1]MEB2785679.1 aminotransferase class I/II-fold pyridoxal phosphate-dependent enzyme [Algoriphagus sp. E1-3-M2]
MDLFAKLKMNMGPLGKHSEFAEGYFSFPKLEGEIAPRMIFQGKNVLTWSLNNYLGLANHPEVRKADADAAAQYGAAYPMGARMMSGQTSLHEQLEDELAAFVKKEKAYLLNYGYQGIMSVIDSLLDRKDVVVYDSECHACIIDALRMHLGKRYVFPHNDIENCEKQLERATKLANETGGGILVITEGVFGMTGDQGKLKEIVALKKKFDFRFLIDDAHGFGTMGKTGAGTDEEQGVQDQVDLYFSTFAKSMASIGAFIAGDPEVIQFLRYNMRSQIFAKSLPMLLVAGALKRLELLKTQPELKDNLWRIVGALRKGLHDNGFSTGKSNSPVTPVVLNGTVGEAAALTQDLRENYGIFCSVVIYPVVPKGMIILRLIPTAVHTLEDVDQTITAFAAIKEKLTSGVYKNSEFAISFGE